MPPPNDDFASATVISGASGEALGTNVGAVDNAVWWKWTAPYIPNTDGSDSLTVASYHYFFTTHADIAHGATQLTDFDTVLALHSSEFVELTPLISASGDNYGWSRQSYAVCFQKAGDVVYIKVSGASGAEGNIRLVWGRGARRFIGGAGICRTTGNLTPVGKARLTSVAAENTVSFDGPYGTSFAAGDYVVRYVDGAFAYNFLISPYIQWATTRYYSSNANLFLATDSGVRDCFIAVEHTGGTVVVPFDAIPKPNWGAPTYAHSNETHAADWARGRMIQFTHGGGGINLHFKDDLYIDNMAGTVLPTFVLYSKS